MQEKYQTLLNQLIKWYHIEQEDLKDLKWYLESQLRQIELRETELKQEQDLQEDFIRDIAITITDKLVENKIIPNCMDTDNETEFETQDIIHDYLKQYNLIKK